MSVALVLLAALIVALLTPRAVLAAQTSAAARARCTGGKTLSRNALARVYKQGGNYYGCVYSVGKPVALNSAAATYDYIWHGLKGTMFAFALRHFGLAPQEVVVRDLRTNRVIHRHAVNLARDFGDMVFAVQRLVVSTNGSVAWLACSSIALTDAFCKSHELHAIGHDNRHRLLDQGNPNAFSGVTINSRRNILTWKYAGAPRSAQLH